MKKKKINNNGREIIIAEILRWIKKDTIKPKIKDNIYELMIDLFLKAIFIIRYKTKIIIRKNEDMIKLL